MNKKQNLNGSAPRPLTRTERRELVKKLGKETERLERLIVSQVLREYLGCQPFTEDYKDLQVIANSQDASVAKIYFRGQYLGDRKTFYGSVEELRPPTVKFKPSDRFKPRDNGPASD